VVVWGGGFSRKRRSDPKGGIRTPRKESGQGTHHTSERGSWSGGKVLARLILLIKKERALILRGYGDRRRGDEVRRGMVRKPSN